jgi:hypothetical protein
MRFHAGPPYEDNVSLLPSPFQFSCSLIEIPLNYSGFPWQSFCFVNKWEYSIRKDSCAHVSVGLFFGISTSRDTATDDRCNAKERMKHWAFWSWFYVSCKIVYAYMLTPTGYWNLSMHPQVRDGDPLTCSTLPLSCWLVGPKRRWARMSVKESQGHCMSLKLGPVPKQEHSK